MPERRDESALSAPEAPDDQARPSTDASVADSLLVSAERLDVSTSWIVSGRLRVRRQIQTEVRTIEVTVRREVLTVDYDDLREAGLANGAPHDARSVPEPPTDRVPLSIVLREEVPIVTMQSQPYEVATIRFSRAHSEHHSTEQLRRETAVLDTTAPAVRAPND